MWFLLTIPIFLLISVQEIKATDFTIGVSPPVIDLGEVEAGSTKIVKFFLVTPSDEELLVYLHSEDGNIDFFNRDQYKIFLKNYSEEPVADWAEFLSNPVELKPSNEILKTYAGEIKGWREISFILRIPKEAEPGYHLLMVRPSPQIPQEFIGQAGARVVAITSVGVLFKVYGDVVRDGVILDVTPGKIVGDSMEINTYFQNTGTVTISARAFQSIFNGDFVENLTSSKEFVKPKEVVVLKTFMPLKNVKPGKFEVMTTVDFITNSTSKNHTLEIKPLPEVPKRVFPWWVVGVVLMVMILILIYKWFR